jgi:hypothetical protein
LRQSSRRRARSSNDAGPMPVDARLLGERGGDALVHQAPHDTSAANLPPVRERVGPIRDARVILDARRRARDDGRQEADHGYHPRSGGRYNAAAARASGFQPTYPSRAVPITVSRADEHHQVLQGIEPRSLA